MAISLLASFQSIAHLLVLLACMTAVAARPRSAEALIFSVDDTADLVDVMPGDGVCGATGGACTLRAAVQESNASPGADGIILPAGTYVLTLVGGDEAAAATGDLDVTGEVTVAGSGASTTIIDGNAQSRLFEVLPTGDLALQRVTLRNGNGSTDSGCDAINASGVCAWGDLFAGGNQFSALTVIDSVIADGVGSNSAGIATLAATLTVSGSTIRGNAGHGIEARATTSTVTTSTIAGNSGTGISLGIAGGMNVENTTLSGNAVGIANGSACVGGHGCSFGPPAGLNNVTIANNGIGINNTSNTGSLSTVTLRNSVVADNTDDCRAVAPPSISGFSSGGYNLIENSTNCTIQGTTTGNVLGVDPLLVPLAPNGGRTDTHALVTSSAAIDAGDPGTSCAAADQRGVSRPGGLHCDMGAYELTLCGNGATDPGEACDDGGFVDGDGCDANCTLTGCGNGIVTTGEQCDDGNVVDGDCCSATCQLVPPETPCDDTDPCTQGGVCAAGTCIAGSSCEPCQHCVPGVGCVAPDQCEVPAARGSVVTIKNAATDAKDSITWSWRHDDPGSFYNPISSAEYTLCVYDGSGGATPVLVTPVGCTPESCWSSSASGYSYKRKLADGTAKLKLKGGKHTRITVSAKGAALLARPPLPLSQPASVRLLSTWPPNDTLCWEASYDLDVRKNDAGTFKAKSD